MLVLSKAVLVIVIEIDSSIVPNEGLGDTIEFHRQSGQHRDDPMQHCLHRSIVLYLAAPRRHQHVLDCGTIKRRTACNVKKPSTIFATAFAVARGNVQRDRLGSANPLVVGMAMSATERCRPLSDWDAANEAATYSIDNW